MALNNAQLHAPQTIVRLLQTLAKKCHKEILNLPFYLTYYPKLMMEHMIAKMEAPFVDLIIVSRLELELHLTYATNKMIGAKQFRYRQE